MATEIASAFVSIEASMPGFRRSVVTEAERSGDAASRSFGSRFGARAKAEGKRAGAIFGKALVAGSAVAGAAGAVFLKGAISEAGNLEQSIGAIDTVFKKSAGRMHEWGKGAAQAVGLSRNEFNELGTLIGSQLKNGGTAMDQLAPKTNKLIKLGADLSSMFGGTSREAIEALSSALKGERDPIERYGVTLNQAKIDAEAAALGFKKVDGAFDNQAQQAATLSLIFKQTSDAQGNFARESDTLQGKQQRLSAQWTDMKAKLGGVLLPQVTRFVGFLNDQVGPALDKVKQKVQPVVQALGDRLAPVVDRVTGFMRDNPAVVKAFAIALGVLALAIGVVTLATAAFSLALNSTGIPLVIIAIAALVAGLVYAYQHSEQFRSIIDKVGQILRTFGAFVRDEIVPVIVDLAQKVATNLQPVWVALVDFFRGSVLPVVQQLISKFQSWQPTIQRVIGVVASLVAKWIDFYTSVLGKVLPVVIRFAGFLLRNLIPTIGKVVGAVATIISKLVAFAKKVAEAAKAVGDFAKKVGKKVGDVLTWIGELPGKALSALGDVGELLLNAGKDIIQGLWNGLKEKWEDVKGWLGGITKSFPKRKGPPAKDKRLLFKSGQLIMGGLQRGLRDGYGGVETTLTKITDRLGTFIDKKKVGKKVAAQMSGVVDRISSAFQYLNEAMMARNDLASSVASGFGSEWSLSDIFGKNEFGLSLGAGSAVKAAQSIVARIRAFAGQLTQLVAAGMPGPLVQEIAGLGSVEGKRVADVLLQGGAGTMSQISGAYNDFKAIAHAAGMTVADATYGVDIDRAEAAFAAAIERGLAKMGIEIKAQIGVTNDAAVQILDKGQKRKKKRQ